MTTIAETASVGAQCQPLGETTQKGSKTGGEGGDLFAALLAALASSIAASQEGQQTVPQPVQGEIQIVAESAQGAQNTVDVEGALTVNVAPEVSLLEPAVTPATPMLNETTVPNAVFVQPEETPQEAVVPSSENASARAESVVTQESMPSAGSENVPGGSQPDESKLVSANGLSVTIRLPVGDGKPVAFVKDFAELEGDPDGASGDGAEEPEPGPLRVALTRVQSDVARERILAAEMRQEARQGGEDLPRSSSDRSFPEQMVLPDGVRIRHMASTTTQQVPRLSDVAEARMTQAVIDQTVKGVLLSVRNGSSEMRLRLKPDHLGELNLRLVFKDNILNLDLSTQNASVRNAIESNISQLRQVLDKNGVDLGTVSVTVDPELASGGHFNRSPHAFLPFEGDLSRPYQADRALEDQPSEGWVRRRWVRDAVNLIDVIA